MICKRSEKDGQLHKMSKSKGNVVSPDELVERYGGDTLRLYTLFIGPPEKDAEWDDRGIEGASRFLRRFWRRVYQRREVILSAQGLECGIDEMDAAERDLHRKTHDTIVQVTRDVDGAFHFNAAIAKIMELTNALDECELSGDSPRPRKVVYRNAVETIVLLLSPLAPHISEELWKELGHGESILRAPWPVADEAALVRKEIQIVVQVNGKVRGRIEVPADIPDDDLRALAIACPQVQSRLEGKTVQKVVIVPGKLVSIVAVEES